MIITATEVTVYSNISASTAQVTASGLIPVVQDRVNWICNNYFTTDLYLQQAVTFNATAGTITGTTNYTDRGFADGDEIYVYQSYRNDGYYSIASVTTTTITIASSGSVVDELSGRSVLVSVIAWPADLKYTVAQMIAYDYDRRAGRSAGATSIRLGPWAETYGEAGNGEFGYPKDLIAPLYDHKIVRLM